MIYQEVSSLLIIWFLISLPLIHVNLITSDLFKLNSNSIGYFIYFYLLFSQELKFNFNSCEFNWKDIIPVFNYLNLMKHRFDYKDLYSH